MLFFKDIFPNNDKMMTGNPFNFYEEKGFLQTDDKNQNLGCKKDFANGCGCFSFLLPFLIIIYFIFIK